MTCLKFVEKNKNYFEATNVLSDHRVSVCVDMLGAFCPAVEWQDETGAWHGIDEYGFETLEEAASWAERQDQCGVIMETRFDGSPIVTKWFEEVA